MCKDRVLYLKFIIIYVEVLDLEDYVLYDCYNLLKVGVCYMFIRGGQN